MSREETNAGIAAVMTIGGTIRDRRETSSASLYETVRRYIDRPLFDRVVSMLAADGLVRVSGDWLRWIGPK